MVRPTGKEKRKTAEDARMVNAPQARPGTEPGTAPAARTNLREQYREIGISALAAALCYRGEAKNDAYAPVKARRTPHPEDMAA
jgi:hypothetical protein